MSTDDNNAYEDLDKSNLKFIYEQFRRKNILLLDGRIPYRSGRSCKGWEQNKKLLHTYMTRR